MTISFNVSAVFDIVNATTARSTVKDVSEHLYRTLQIAVRQTLGKRTLEEVLGEKADIDAEKQAQANLIRRREETAATRSLLNTAN